MAILTGAIIRALFTCAATERMRFALNGIHVSPLADGKGTLLQAMDGRRLIRLSLSTNGTGTGFITAEHVKAMKAGDVVTITGDTLTIHGPFAVVAKLGGKECGMFPDTQAIVDGDAKPWEPNPNLPPITYGYNPELLSEIMAALSVILEEPTCRVKMDGGKPMRVQAKGMATSAKHEAAQRAAAQLGAKTLPVVGTVEVDAFLMPLAMD